MFPFLQAFCFLCWLMYALSWLCCQYRWRQCAIDGLAATATLLAFLPDGSTIRPDFILTFSCLASAVKPGGASVLFMGRPGVGKTTAIRELSRLMADDLARRVVIVDTSNEIGGDGDVPHIGIGRARRMQVRRCVLCQVS
jgi:hypothetical protein